MMPEKIGFLEWLGLSKTPKWMKSRLLGGFISVFVALLAIVILISSIAGLTKALITYAFDANIDKNPSEAIRNIGLWLVALVAFPITVIRLKLTSEQNKHNENVLFNDKLHQANADLHAQRQVTVPVKEKNGKDSHKRETIWEDDIIRRNGAIDRLGELAVEAAKMGQPEIVPRIARILCTYLKEMSREFPAEIIPKEIKVSPYKRLDWIIAQEVKRTDMEAATQVLGRLHRRTGISSKKLAIDLTGVNLQFMNLSDLDFEEASAPGVKFHGTHLNNVNFTSAYLINANFSGAYLRETNFSSATLVGTDFNASHLINVNFKKAFLFLADLTFIFPPKFEDLKKQLVDSFGDKSVKLPADACRPDHWLITELNEEKIYSGIVSGGKYPDTDIYS